MEMTGQRLAEYEREYADRLKKPPRAFPLNEVAQEHLERMLAMIREAGAEPVLFITPPTSPAKLVPRRPMKVPLLDFTDVHRWPELFVHENRLDTGHVNAAGARVFTRMIFEEFFKTLPQAGEPGSLPPSNRSSDDR